MARNDDAVRLQEELAGKVVVSDDFGTIEKICGIDVAYDNDVAYCSAVVMDSQGSSILESVDCKVDAKNPYIPGLLMLREAEPIFHTLKRLKKDYNLLLIDGHGVLHPRRCGLACYVGLTLDKPTIGVAKSILCGTVREDGFVELGNKVLGFAMSPGGRRKLYVSVGHKISLATSIAIVRDLSKRGAPEPLRLADINSKIQKRGIGLGGG